jgi:hypothetical protein
MAANALTLGDAAAQSEARRIIHAGLPYSALDTATVESQALLAPVQLYLRYSTKLGWVMLYYRYVASMQSLQLLIGD